MTQTISFWSFVKPGIGKKESEALAKAGAFFVGDGYVWGE
jgi:hypothetical protein